MSQSEHLVATLKRCLKANGLTYADLAKAIGLSEAGVKKAFADGNFTVKRLEQICGVMGMSIGELVRVSGTVDDNAARCLTLDQEHALVADESMFAFFYLLLSGLTPAKIVATYDFTTREADRCLLDLDKAGLIELHPGNRVRCKVPLNFEWLRGGPLKKRFDEDVKREFLASPFDGPLERIDLVAGRLTEASVRVMRKRLEKLVGEFRELVELDRNAGREKTKGIWILGAMRPWTFSLVGSYRKGAARRK